MRMIAFAKRLVSREYDVTNSIMLYGGSLKPSNAQEILSKPSIDGGLIGGACLKIKDFEDFKQKLEYYLSHENERKDMAKRAQKITLEKFTNVKAAEKFIDILKNIKK